MGRIEVKPLVGGFEVNSGAVGEVGACESSSEIPGELGLTPARRAVEIDDIRRLVNSPGGGTDKLLVECLEPSGMSHKQCRTVASNGRGSGSPSSNIVSRRRESGSSRFQRTSMVSRAGAEFLFRNM